MKKYIAPQAKKKRAKKELVDAWWQLEYQNSKRIQLLFQGREIWISWILGGHLICRIRTVSDSTKTFSSDTLGDSTSRFDPFFCRIVGVLTVGTYNVPSGSSAKSLTRKPKAGRARSASLMGRMGRVGRIGRSSKVSFKFLHTLWEYRTYIYFYTK